MSSRRKRLAAEYGYSPPLDARLEWGAARLEEPWPNYLKLPFALEHVPDLLRMAADSRLRNLESGRELWAPTHAIRVVGQLRPVEAVPALLLFLVVASGDHDHFLSDELPLVFALIGPDAIAHLSLFLGDAEVPADSRGLAALSLALIGAAHDDSCAPVGERLVACLRKWSENAPELNSALLLALASLPEWPPEALVLAKRAYEADAVDEFAGGDWDETQEAFGVEELVPLDRAPFETGPRENRRGEDSEPARMPR